MPVCICFKIYRQACSLLNYTSKLYGGLEIILLWKVGKQGEKSREGSLDCQGGITAVMCYVAALQF